jgi:hypothetical protein
MASSRVTAKFGTISTSNLDLLTGAVTQLTSITSGVSLLTQAGLITTVTATLATQGSASFAVTNPVVSASTVVLANMSNYTGTGLPIVRVTNTTTGSFTLTVNNLDATSALNAPIKISTFLSN